MSEQQLSDNWHVCGVVIQALPEKISAIQTALLAIAHCEVAGVDPQQGKIVVVMQSFDEQILLQQLEQAKEIDGVLALSLVYHEQEK